MTKPFAFVFPGQGSQSVGMLDAWGDHPAVAATLLEASEAAREDGIEAVSIVTPAPFFSKVESAWVIKGNF